LGHFSGHLHVALQGTTICLSSRYYEPPKINQLTRIFIFQDFSGPVKSRKNPGGVGTMQVRHGLLSEETCQTHLPDSDSSKPASTAPTRGFLLQRLPSSADNDCNNRRVHNN